MTYLSSCMTSFLRFDLYCIFLIFHIADTKKELIVPRLLLITPKLPEHGELICSLPGEYILEFMNKSTSWFSLKLEYSVEVTFKEHEKMICH